MLLPPAWAEAHANRPTTVDGSVRHTTASTVLASIKAALVSRRAAARRSKPAPRLAALRLVRAGAADVLLWKCRVCTDDVADRDAKPVTCRVVGEREMVDWRAPAEYFVEQLAAPQRH